MLYNQPLAHRFGTALANDLESEKWQSLEFAVAWVRRSGTEHLATSFSKFLRGGGFGQLTVGVDIENTSAEGLGDLLEWQTEGNLETYIYHNEANPTFHPKVYLFRNDADARLIVGSNNITGAGLFVNTEAGLQLDAPIDDPVIHEARAALASWRDTTELALRLDTTLLGDLVRLGYVFPEQELKQRRKASTDRSRKKRPKAGERLFKSRHFAVPPIRTRRRPRASVPGTVLLMRVRRASETARRTQIQLPIRVVQTEFFVGVRDLVSAHDGRAHTLIRASARGGLNTIKVEIPEIEPMADPVLRLERTATAILYQTFDAASVLGKPIQQALLNGFAMNPPTTFKTVPDEARATWWRFI
jgi:HKD family nuclease